MKGEKVGADGTIIDRFTKKSLSLLFLNTVKARETHGKRERLREGESRWGKSEQMNLPCQIKQVTRVPLVLLASLSPLPYLPRPIFSRTHRECRERALGTC